MKAAILLIAVALAVSCQPKNPTAQGEAGERVEDSGETPAPEEEPDPPSPADPESYIGLTQQAAGERADAAGIPHRTVEIDGKSFPVTMDYRPERLNFEVRDHIVVGVTKG